MAAPQTTAKPSGRPQRLEARFSGDAKAIIQRAADIRGRSVSDFVVSSALEAAEKTIREYDVIVLSARDSMAFAEALLDPKGPNEALREAFRLHREMFDPADGD